MNSSPVFSFTTAIVVIIAVFVSGSNAVIQTKADKSNDVVNGSNYWVVKIAEEACKPGAHDDAATARVFRCYFEIPRTQTFLNCQYKTFGHFLDSEANMDDFCNRWNETFVYYACNQKAFADAGLSSELPAVVEKLNICQAKVLKLGQFADKPSNGQLPGHLGQLLSFLQGMMGQQQNGAASAGMGMGLGLFGHPAAPTAMQMPPPGRK